MKTKCLFCEEISDVVDYSLEHMKITHQFDLENYVNKWNLDTYCTIKVKKNI